MKKVYSKPTVEVIQLSTVNAILEGSGGSGGSVTPGGGSTRPAVNESRGQWGDVWN